MAPSRRARVNSHRPPPASVGSKRIRSRRSPLEAPTPGKGKPPPESPPAIVIGGQVMRPTVVFDTLWRWLVERKKISDNRRAGKPAPWTADEILRRYKFCEAYRVLDRTSQFLVTNVIQQGSQDRTELLFRILLFNCFNRIETWTLLEEAFGELTYSDFDIHAYDRVLNAAIQRRVSLFTGAYMKIAHRLEYDANHMRHLELLEILMVELPPVIHNPKYAADVYEELASYQGMAEFTSFQLMISLSYSPLLNFSANDFVVPGPGASSGLAKMFGRRLSKKIQIDILHHMVAHQRTHFARLGLDFQYLPDAAGQELALTLVDMEHAVCEVDKYARKKHPNIRDTKARTELRGQFRPSPAGLPALPALPEAWGHPARSVVRVRKAPIHVRQRYCCWTISGERFVDGREIQYQVWWQGYEDPTWEPRSTLLEDAPQLVKDYEQRKAVSR